MIKKAHVIAAAAIAATIFGLAGCSSGAPAKDSASGAPSGVLTFNMSSTNQVAWEAVIKKFNQKYPNVRIQPQWVVGGSADAAAQLLAELQGGNGPDIFQVYPGSTGPQSVVALEKAGEIKDLSERPWAKAVPKSIRGSATADGKLGMQDIGIGTGGLVLNGDTMKKLGLTAPTTFKQLLSFCGAVHAKQSNLIPLSFGVSTAGFASFVGGMVAASKVYDTDPDWNTKRLDDKVTFADSDWNAALAEFSAMQSANCFSSGVAGDAVPTMFQQVPSGQALGALGITSAFGPILNAAGDVNWEIVPFPFASADKTSLVIRPNTGFAINANTKNYTAAKAFSDFVGQPAVMELWSKTSGYAELPPTVFSSGNWPAIYKGLKAYSSRQILDPEIGWPTAGTATALANGIVAILTKQKTVAQVTQSLDASWNK